MQADAFTGYDGIYLGSQGKIVEVACNAHARRKFFEARSTDAVRAHAALAFYRQLYGVEREIKDELERLAGATDLTMSAVDAAALTSRWRQEKALPVLVQFRAWLQEQRPVVLPKSPIGEAISYTLGNWDALSRDALLVAL